MAKTLYGLQVRYFGAKNYHSISCSWILYLQNLRTGESTRRSCSHANQLENKQLVLGSRQLDVGRVGNVKNGCVSEEKCEKTNSTKGSLFESSQPQNKRFKSSDNPRVLKNVNKNDEAQNVDSSDGNNPQMCDEISSSSRRYQSNAFNRRPSSTRGKTSVLENLRFDQNTSPSTSVAGGNYVPPDDKDDAKLRSLRVRRYRPNVAQKIVTISSRRGMRDPPAKERLLPVPAPLGIAENGFELPLRRKVLFCLR